MILSQDSQKQMEEARSNQGGQNDESKNKQDVYFLILRPSEEKIEFAGLNYETKNKIEPKIAFKKRVDKEDKTFLEEIVFKFKKKVKKKEKDKDKKESTKSTKYSITFFEGDHTYDISFSLKDECFAYQPDLKTGNKYLNNILKEPIRQNTIPFYNKLNIFLEALEKNNELEIKEKKLYEDIIAL
jgi:hypothetical protein